MSGPQVCSAVSAASWTAVFMEPLKVLCTLAAEAMTSAGPQR